ncbi:hypothetical protein [Nostoc sp. MS1]|uniref:hypothetical protein n=1 Tax=Nostoc sp. MS1 TaxID=2764711 RepID=UPI001CC40F65|nr:hypothetical protein [Nostoc sp. MS1]BCL34278.1 hypothetical protein NSMS1_07250 [Nostoc sp. MS1]
MSKSVSIDEFLQRVASQPEGNTWSAIIFPQPDYQQLVDDLNDSLTIFAECEVGCISGKIFANDLVEQIVNKNEDYLILGTFESWDNHQWFQLDCQRSKLMRKRGVVLVLSPESAKAMFSYAPNIASWLGFRVFNFLKDTELLSIKERQARLESLREWSGLTDTQVIEMAEAQTLPLDPEYAEWLVLLERGDLIEQ